MKAETFEMIGHYMCASISFLSAGYLLGRHGSEGWLSVTMFIMFGFIILTFIQGGDPLNISKEKSE